MDQCVEGVSKPLHLNLEIVQEEQGFRPISSLIDLRDVAPTNLIFINSLVQLKGFPIVILVGLQATPMP